MDASVAVTPITVTLSITSQFSNNFKDLHACLSRLRITFRR
jgi:hypothetical protein